jgi:hypothetical protein
MRFLYTSYFLGIESYMLPCFTKQLWGFDCPGCGLQRAIVFLIQGEFGAAFEMYPAIYPMLFLLGFIALDKLVSFKFSHIITISLALITAGTIITNYILKFL